MKPTGFTIMAGRGRSLETLGRRIEGNSIAKEALPVPRPRMFLQTPPDEERRSA
jgi:hypothetical protein